MSNIVYIAIISYIIVLLIVLFTRLKNQTGLTTQEEINNHLLDEIEGINFKDSPSKAIVLNRYKQAGIHLPHEIIEEVKGSSLKSIDDNIDLIESRRRNLKQEMNKKL